MKANSPVSFDGKIVADLSKDIEKNFGDALDRIRHSAFYEVKTTIEEFLDSAQLYPERQAPQIHIWAFDRPIKVFDLEKVLLEWFDETKWNASATKGQLEGWVAKLEGIAARLRTVIAEERYVETEE